MRRKVRGGKTWVQYDKELQALSQAGKTEEYKKLRNEQYAKASKYEDYKEKYANTSFLTLQLLYEALTRPIPPPQQSDWDDFLTGLSLPFKPIVNAINSIPLLSEILTFVPIVGEIWQGIEAIDTAIDVAKGGAKYKRKNKRNMRGGSEITEYDEALNKLLDKTIKDKIVAKTKQLEETKQFLLKQGEIIKLSLDLLNDIKIVFEQAENPNSKMYEVMSYNLGLHPDLLDQMKTQIKRVNREISEFEKASTKFKYDEAHFIEDIKNNVKSSSWQYVPKLLSTVLYDQNGNYLRNLTRDELTNLPPQIKKINNKYVLGTGIVDTIKSSVKTFFSRSLDYNNKSKETLKQYGNCPIVQLSIYRTPIQAVIRPLLNALTFGKFNQLTKDYDKLFHVALIAQVNCNGTLKNVVLEKSATLNISSEYKTSKDTEVYKLILPTNKITVNELLQKTRTAINNDSLYFGYNYLTNNCQIWIYNILKSNNLLNLNQGADKWLLQPLQDLVKKLPDYVHKISTGITETGAIINKLTGQGIPDMKVHEIRSLIIKCDLPIKDHHKMNKKQLLNEIKNIIVERVEQMNKPTKKGGSYKIGEGLSHSKPIPDDRPITPEELGEINRIIRATRSEPIRQALRVIEHGRLLQGHHRDYLNFIEMNELMQEGRTLRQAYETAFNTSFNEVQQLINESNRQIRELTDELMARPIRRPRRVLVPAPAPPAPVIRATQVRPIVPPLDLRGLEEPMLEGALRTASTDEPRAQGRKHKTMKNNKIRFL